MKRDIGLLTAQELDAIERDIDARKARELDAMSARELDAMAAKTGAQELGAARVAKGTRDLAVLANHAIALEVRMIATAAQELALVAQELAADASAIANDAARIAATARDTPREDGS